MQMHGHEHLARAGWARATIAVQVRRQPTFRGLLLVRSLS
jgi:hypothetical protein